MQLIDVDSLIKWLTMQTGFKTNCEDCCENDCYDCILEEAIKNAPVYSNVAPVVHAHWIERDSPLGFKNYECSNCQHTDGKHTAFRGHYCWYCGAKMDEIED